VAEVACGGVRGGIAPGSFVCPAKVRACATQGACFSGGGGQFCVTDAARCAPWIGGPGIALLAACLALLGAVYVLRSSARRAPSVRT
jgi:hypothetical protein